MTPSRPHWTPVRSLTMAVAALALVIGGCLGSGIGGNSAPAETLRVPAGVPPLAPKTCQLNEVFCLDENGNALPDEEPPDLEPGQPLTIMILGGEQAGELELSADPPIGLSSSYCFSDEDGGAGNGDGGVEASGTTSESVLSFGAGPSSSPDETGGGGASHADGGSGRTLLQLHIAEVPNSQFIVHYKWYTSCERNSSVRLDRPITFTVGQSGYHLDPAFMFPIVFNGQRQVNLVPVPNTRDHTIQVSESIAPVPLTLSLQMFPLGIWGGHQSTVAEHAGQVWCERESYDKKAAKSCNPVGILWEFLRPLGLIIGTDIAPNQVDQYYLGGTYQPVRGFAFSVGAAFVKGAFIPRNYVAGELAPTNGTSFQPDIQYMTRPFIGVAISPEVLSVLVDLLNSAKKIGAPPAGKQ